MKTLAKVGATNNSLWWATNGVSLLFAAAKCGTTVRENPYTDTIMFFTKSGTRTCLVQMIKWKQEFRNLISGGQDSDFWNDLKEAV